MTWLIAEDEADIRNLIITLCTVWGHPTLAFENGSKAWAWMDQVEGGTFTGTLPELALMDIRMPGKRGDELAQRMRTIPALQDIPVVLMTAFSLTESEIQAMTGKDGADHLIHKPLPSFDDLHNILKTTIRAKQST